MESNVKLDKIDWKILKELENDARVSYAELARRVNLSAPAVTERVQKLEDAKVICGYKTIINPASLGLSIMAIIQMSLPSTQWTKLMEVIESIPEIVECHRATGDVDLFMKVRVNSMDAIERIIDQLVAYGEPNTSLILSTPIEERSIGYIET